MPKCLDDVAPPAVRGRWRGRSRHARLSAREKVLRSNNRFWRPSDLSGSASTVQHALAAMTAAGELIHVRRGLYWRGRQTPLGMSPPSTDALVRELAGEAGVGPAGLSAALALGPSNRVPRRAVFAVPSRAPSAAGTVVFRSRPSRSGCREAQLSPVEVALLEVLDGWDKVIELPLDQAWQRLRVEVQSDRVRAGRLASAGRTEPGAVRARLSALLKASDEATAAARVGGVDPRTAIQAVPRELVGAGPQGRF